jgi:hypothetical protein
VTVKVEGKRSAKLSARIIAIKQKLSKVKNPKLMKALKGQLAVSKALLALRRKLKNAKPEIK